MSGPANIIIRDVEAQLINLGFKVVSLRSSHSQEERSKYLHDFNHDPDVQVLLFNTKLGSQSLNLYIGGHRIIGCEMPVNMGTWLQVVGRVCRVGQRFEQVIYLLWVSDSYDQILLHKLCRKFVSTFAGEGGTIKDGHDITENAEEVFRKFFGLRYSPYADEWGDSNYVSKYKWIKKHEKDKLAEEEVREAEDDGTDMVTPAKKSRPQSFVPSSSTSKIGISRTQAVGQYRTNIARDVVEGKLAVPVRQG
jgi:superfamily II DNA/RNA helicase